MTTVLQQQYQEMKTKVEDQMKQMREVGQKMFAESAQFLFNTYPDLEDFSWRQYTPYFNDGDECVFGVHTEYPAIRLTNGFDDDVDVWSTPKADDPPEKIIGHAVKDLLVQLDSDTMKQLFGDHVKITVRRDGSVSVTEQEHE